jgi:hypothetical protein
MKTKFVGKTSANYAHIIRKIVQGASYNHTNYDAVLKISITNNDLGIYQSGSLIFEKKCEN